MRKVNIFLDDTLWRQFRIGCIEHETTASKQLARLIAAQLSQWGKERNEDHADHDHDPDTP